MSVSRLHAAAVTGPGPRTRREAGALFLKGALMGTADIIPGVSGGTIAFITGIYEQLIAAIKSVDTATVADLVRLRLVSALDRVHLRFLVPLLAGVAAAILIMARVVHHFLEHHPEQLWALFFGLIAASIIIVGRKMGGLTPARTAALLGGTAAGWLIVGLVPTATPETWWFLMLCGAAAICAMILPGISGAFILLILGKYEYVTGALKNPFDPASLLVIALFGIGCVAGIASFARVLSWLLHHFHGPTIALLTGFMAGALRKIWPWKETLATELIRGKTYVTKWENVLPGSLDAGVWACLGLMILGFGAALAIERLGGRETKEIDHE
jgi:putative membrane protein